MVSDVDVWINGCGGPLNVGRKEEIESGSA